ncbi:flagellar biosynthesis protein FlhF [Desulfovibrio subterraneus]|uniref:Flagellar biosynthesis protein FlhF n=1 Tax=Desulfovibrio subterraneus TaxID=2718620 RepID=A0A7J0BQ56_9BACT|nr:flagellar biosynthesis protein FlhF [Desulfovibrio subterraneus]GFM35265.1 flagellar biosynthesis protein FlhF [Desulfovibrio subterraneus]
MQVKTFTGPDAKTVLARIKQEMGLEAVILSKHEGADDGGPWCEMTAGLERSATSVKKMSSGNGNGNGNGNGSGTPTGWNEWHREWSEIREHLLALMKPGIQLDELAPRQRVALEYLEREGVDNVVLLSLFRRLHKSPNLSVLVPLSEIVPLQPWGEEEWPQHCHALTGPFGAGKTSTLIRMAISLRSRRPDIRICIVNADCERGNGRLLLKHYAELSDITYLEAGDPVSFANMLRETRDYDKVLIDLPGLGRNDTFSTIADKLGLGTARDLAVHLVLTPSYAPAQLTAFMRQYVTDCPGSIIWTKLDEACTFGALVSLAASSGLPVSALSFGPGLKNTLIAARDVTIWRLLFKHQLPCDADPRNGM